MPICSDPPASRQFFEAEMLAPEVPAIEVFDSRMGLFASAVRSAQRAGPDRDRSSRKLTKLTMNPVKHGLQPEQGGQREIVVEVSGNRVCLSLADDGCGIARGQIDKVFDPFFTTGRGHGGTGLGLNIVEHHGQAIWRDNFCAQRARQRRMLSFALPTHSSDCCVRIGSKRDKFQLERMYA